MDKREKSLYALAGALAGFANGLLGAGGGLDRKSTRLNSSHMA